LTQQGGETLPDLFQDMTQGGAESKTKGVLEGAKETLFGSSSDDDEDEDGGGSSRTRSRSRSRSTTRSRGRS